MLLAALLAAASAGLAAASTGAAYLVKDLAPGPTVELPRGYSLTPLASTGAWALAYGLPGHPGETGEPWVTDGTGEGTRMLRDLTPGATESDVSDAVAVGAGIFFSAPSPGTGVELWWTDGTSAGTRLVADLRPGRAGSLPQRLGVLGGLYLFSADDGVHGRELWASDGTGVGTVLLADLWPGPAGALDGCPERAGEPAAVFDGRLYFAANGGFTGCELYRSDGLPKGTGLFAELVPGAGGGSPADFLAAAGRLFFTARDPAHGRELWATDGGSAGTGVVADLRPGAASSSPLLLGAIPGALIFGCDDGSGSRTLWASNGSPDGTGRVSAVRPGPDEAAARNWAAALAGRLLFAGWDAEHGLEPWVTDGTAAGTRLLADLVPGGWGSGPHGFAPLGTGLVFGGWADSEGHSRLWWTDGTPAGTSPLADTGAADEGLEVSVAQPVAAGAVLSVVRYFSPGPYTDMAVDLWVTNGKPAGTQPVLGTQTVGTSSSPFRLSPRAAGIAFNALAAEGFFLYSDGTEAGTSAFGFVGFQHLEDVHDSAPLPDGELLLNGADQDWGVGFFRTDGDVVSPLAWPGAPLARDVVRAGDLVYINHGSQDLWRSDGTAAGTVLLRSFTGLTGLADVFGKAWFRAQRNQLESSLWESSGTLATTVGHPLPGVEFVAFRPLAIVPLDPAAGTFTFQAADGLYRFDPGAGAATLFHALARPSNGFDQAVLGGRLYFFDEEADGACSLWGSDGTAAGTARVATWASGACAASQLVAVGGRLFFAACDWTAGCEPWTSDGSQAGTVRLRDLDAGIFSSMPAWLTPAIDRLYFVACDGEAGCEPWVSDGTEGGTHRVGDLAPGPASSLPPAFQEYQDSSTPNLTAWGRLVFFAADDGTGTELWAAPVEIFYDGFESGDTSRWIKP